MDYSCVSETITPSGTVAVGLELETGGKIVRGWSRWELQTGEDQAKVPRGLRKTRFELRYRSSEGGLPFELDRAVFQQLHAPTHGGAAVYATLNGGQQAMVWSYLDDLGTDDKSFLAALPDASAIAVDTIDADGTSLAHAVIYPKRDDWLAVKAEQLRRLAAASEKAKTYARSCEPGYLELDRF